MNTHGSAANLDVRPFLSDKGGARHTVSLGKTPSADDILAAFIGHYDPRATHRAMSRISLQDYLRGILPPHGPGNFHNAEVDLDQLWRVLSGDRVNVEGLGQAVLYFSAGGLSDVLAFKPSLCLARIGPRLSFVHLQLTPPRPERNNPAMDELYVMASDLADFVADPAVQGSSGAPFRLPLMPNDLRDLLLAGTCRVNVGSKIILVSVLAGPMKDAPSMVRVRHLWSRGDRLDRTLDLLTASKLAIVSTASAVMSKPTRDGATRKLGGGVLKSEPGTIVTIHGEAGASGDRYGVLIPNPIYHEPLTVDLILSRAEAISSSLLEPRLSGGFEALRLARILADGAQINADRRPSRGADDQQLTLALALAASRPASTDKASVEEDGKRVKLEHFKTAAGSLRRTSQMLADPRNASDAAAVVGFLLGGETDRIHERLIGARRWIALGLIARRSPALYAIIDECSQGKLGTEDSDVWSLGARAESATAEARYGLEFRPLLHTRPEELVDLIAELAPPGIDAKAELRHASLQLSDLGLDKPDDCGVQTLASLLALNFETLTGREPLRQYDLAERDLAAVRGLISHIEERWDYYAYVIFQSATQDRRAALVSDFLWKTCGIILGASSDLELLGRADDQLVVAFSVSACPELALLPALQGRAGEKKLAAPRKG